METVVAVFENKAQGREGFNHLVNAGFDPENISFITARDEDRVYEIRGEAAGKATAEGMISGGVLGGLAAGLAALAIPGLGPIVAAGPIAAALTGMTVGAAAGGVIGALVGLGLPAEDAEMYAEAVRRGHTLIAVKSAEIDAVRVRDLLDEHEPLNLDKASGTWRQEGWTGFNYEGYETYKPFFLNRHRLAYGGVPFASYEPAYRYGYYLATDDRYAAIDDWSQIEAAARESWETNEDGPWDDFKEAVFTAWNRVKESTRETLAGIEEFFDDDDGYVSYRDQFLTHYNTTYAGSSYPYEDYDRAYRYGYALATYDRYDRVDSWDELEASGKEEWEAHFSRPWQEFKEAVRHGWEVASHKIAHAWNDVTGSRNGRTS